jgi:signal transduction histidine kinase
MDFLESALLEAADRESQRIGQELHDHLCQHLLGAAFAAKALANSLPAGSQAATDAADVARLVNSAVQQVRDTARGLNPVDLGASGLPDALRELARRPRCSLECEQTVVMDSAEAARHAYRIAEEAVTNAIKHAGAQKIVVRLSENEDSILLEILDDGSGFDHSPDAPKSVGIESMKIRARALGGRLSIDTRKSGGTSVICVLPKRK